MTIETETWLIFMNIYHLQQISQDIICHFSVSSIIPSNGRAHTSHTTTNYNSTCTENVLSEVIKLEAARTSIVEPPFTDQQIKKEIEIISNEASTITNRHLSQFTCPLCFKT